MQKYIYCLLYSLSYALNLISFELMNDDNDNSIIPKSKTILLCIEAVIIVFFTIIMMGENNIEFDKTGSKWVFLAGMCYTGFTISLYYIVEYTLPAFANNNEFMYVLITFVIELLSNRGKLHELPTIIVMGLMGTLGNYGLLGFTDAGSTLGYVFCVITIVMEVLVSNIIVYSKAKCLYSSFLIFMIGLFCSSTIATIIEYLVYPSTFYEYYNNYVYMNIVCNMIYMIGYFFIVDLFGITYDSISCAVALVYTVIYANIVSDVYDHVVSIMASSSLLLTALIHINNNYTNGSKKYDTAPQENNI